MALGITLFAIDITVKYSGTERSIIDGQCLVQQEVSSLLWWSLGHPPWRHDSRDGPLSLREFFNNAAPFATGGVFAAAHEQAPYFGSLLVLAWTFFVPLFYKGAAS